MLDVCDENNEIAGGSDPTCDPQGHDDRSNEETKGLGWNQTRRRIELGTSHTRIRFCTRYRSSVCGTKTTVATTEGRVQYALVTASCRRTVCACRDCDDNGQRPVEENSEDDKCDKNVDKCGDDVEQYELRINE